MEVQDRRIVPLAGALVINANVAARKVSLHIHPLVDSRQSPVVLTLEAAHCRTTIIYAYEEP